MSEVMNQYELLAPFQSKNAGFSRWTYAIKDNKQYFIKEFLDPVYPDENSLSLNLRKQRIRDCEDYELKKKHLYEEINIASDGNLVRIEEFFRFDARYYIATERIIGQSIPIQLMHTIPFENRFLLCKTISHSIRKLHQAHIVHADIKNTNILLKMTQTQKLVGKVFDFDASFFENDPPRYEDELVGDSVYLAPEACQFICGDSVKLTCKIDVFALGLLFHQYLTGSMPGFNDTEYDYPFDAVLDGQELRVSAGLPSPLQRMIKGMLEGDPEKRLTMENVYSIFQELDPDTVEDQEDAECDTKETSVQTDDWFYYAGDL